MGESICISNSIVTDMKEEYDQPLLFVELSNASNIKLVDQSNWWPRDDDDVFSFITSPTYASGSIYVDAMLYPMLGVSHAEPYIVDLVQVLLGVQKNRKSPLLQIVAPK